VKENCEERIFEFSPRSADAVNVLPVPGGPPAATVFAGGRRPLASSRSVISSFGNDVSEFVFQVRWQNYVAETCCWITGAQEARQVPPRGVARGALVLNGRLILTRVGWLPPIGAVAPPTAYGLFVPQPPQAA